MLQKVLKDNRESIVESWNKKHKLDQEQRHVKFLDKKFTDFLCRHRKRESEKTGKRKSPR